MQGPLQCGGHCFGTAPGGSRLGLGLTWRRGPWKGPDGEGSTLLPPLGTQVRGRWATLSAVHSADASRRGANEQVAAPRTWLQPLKDPPRPGQEAPRGDGGRRYRGPPGGGRGSPSRGCSRHHPGRLVSPVRSCEPCRAATPGSWTPPGLPPRLGPCHPGCCLQSVSLPGGGALVGTSHGPHVLRSSQHGRDCGATVSGWAVLRGPCNAGWSSCTPSARGSVSAAGPPRLGPRAGTSLLVSAELSVLGGTSAVHSTGEQAVRSETPLSLPALKGPSPCREGVRPSLCVERWGQGGPGCSGCRWPLVSLRSVLDRRERGLQKGPAQVTGSAGPPQPQRWAQ